jgi:hypothetical protein
VRAWSPSSQVYARHLNNPTKVLSEEDKRESELLSLSSDNYTPHHISLDHKKLGVPLPSNSNEEPFPLPSEVVSEEANWSVRLSTCSLIHNPNHKVLSVETAWEPGTLILSQHWWVDPVSGVHGDRVSDLQFRLATCPYPLPSWPPHLTEQSQRKPAKIRLRVSI